MGLRGYSYGAPARKTVADPSLPPPASSSSDELSWIIELLEKDGMTFQEGLGDSGPFGENPFSPFLSLACLVPSAALPKC